MKKAQGLARALSSLVFTKLCIMARLTQLAAILATASFAIARKPTLEERQIPTDPTGVKTITSPQGASIRFKQPGKQGVCETTEGVDDYAGYISLNEKTNMFFWFFEARENPSEKPLTLWYASFLPVPESDLTNFKCLTAGPARIL